ncbi:hypothetical protein GGI43DRAFT_309189 [Trichoderma evansii]
MDTIKIHPSLLRQAREQVSNTETPVIASVLLQIRDENDSPNASHPEPLGRDLMVLPLHTAQRLNLKILTRVGDAPPTQEEVIDMVLCQLTRRYQAKAGIVRPEIDGQDSNTVKDEDEDEKAPEKDVRPESGGQDSDAVKDEDEEEDSEKNSEESAKSIAHEDLPFVYEPRSWGTNLNLPSKPGQNLGFVPRPQRVARAIEKIHFGFIFRRQVRQRADPISLHLLAQQEFQFICIEELLKNVHQRIEGIELPNRNTVTFQNAWTESRGSYIKSRALHNFELRFSAVSPRCFFLIDRSKYPEELKNRFDYYVTLRRRDAAKKAQVPRAINVYISELLPYDSSQLWFSEIAWALVKTMVRVIVKRDGKRAVHNHGLHGHIEISGLTAAALTMKAHGDIEEIVRLFSYAPRVVAGDMRKYRMGAAFGTVVLQNILASIMAKIAQNDYNANQTELFQAVVDVLASYIGREDHRRFVVEKMEEKKGVVEKLRKVLSLSPSLVFDGNYKNFLKASAVRDGLAYAGIRAYAQDLDRNNQAHVSYLKTALDVVGEVVSAGAGAAAGPAAGVAKSGIQSAWKAFTTLVTKGTTKGWELGVLTRAVDSHFHENVRLYAKQHHVAGLQGEVPPEFYKDVESFIEVADGIAKHGDTEL